MLSEFEKKVAGYVKANGLFGPAQKLLLAVSGGADSTALLHVMHALKTEGEVYVELLCAHMNHQLRADETDSDEKFVVAQANDLDVPVTTRRLDVGEYARINKLSIETAARQLRIQALGDVARANKCDAVITAHQKNDNAETVVQRLTRGTGFRGLAGIWPERIFTDGIKYVRPLLCVGRDEIITYLRERNLQWRCDRTNEDCTYRRNYIRHRLLPELQRNADHSIVELLSELADSARGFSRLINSRVDELWPEVADCTGDEMRLDAKLFLALARPVKVEIVRRCLDRIGCGERYLTQKHYENILQLAEQNVTGRKIELPGDFVASREYGNIIFSPVQKRSAGQAPPCGDKSATLNVPGQKTFARYSIEATILDADEAGLEQFLAGKTDRIERFDLEKIKLPLVVRFKRPGDRFIPLGQTSQKKIGKFLTAQRIPRQMRKEVLVVTGDEEIIWVCPVRISESAKVTNETCRILQLRITDLESPQNSVDAAESGQ